MYNFTENEKLAALHLVDECLYSMGGDRPLDIFNDEHVWTSPEVLMDLGWSKHEAAGTYGALEAKGAVYIEKENLSYYEKDAWTDLVCLDVFKWAEDHWDAFVDAGKPKKAS